MYECHPFRMTIELEVALLKLNLQSYLSTFLFAGFYDWKSLSSITEANFAALGVLRGHRRKLQRAFARSGGWPDSYPLPPTIDHFRVQDGFAEVRAVDLSSESMSSCSNTSGSPASDFKAASSPATELSNDSNSLEVLQSRIPFIQCVREIVGTGSDKKSLLLQGIDLKGLGSRTTSGYHNNPDGIFDGSESAADSFDVLIFEVRKVFLSPPYGSAYDGTSCRQSNPSFNYSIPTLTSYLEAFLEKLNSFLYLFDESDLRKDFQYFVLTNGCLPGLGSVAELYLVLALGAKLSSPDSTKAYLDLYARTSNSLSNSKWGKNLWVMRMLTLLSACHCDDDHENYDQSCHYLNLALRVGKAVGLDRQDSPLASINEPERSHWLRVWDSLRFLHSWHQTCGRGPLIPLSHHDSFVDTMRPPITTEDEYNSRVLQMSVLFIGSFLHTTITDFSKIPDTTPAICNIHLQSLHDWYAGLAPFLCARPQSDLDADVFYGGLTERQKSNLLIVHSLYYGMICHILQAEIITSALSRSSEVENGKAQGYSSQCIQAAESLLRLCTNLAESGMSLYGNAITSYFLLNATIILLFDTSRAQLSQPTLHSNEQLHPPFVRQRIDLIRGARSLLDDCVGVKDSPQSQIVEMFCDSWIVM